MNILYVENHAVFAANVVREFLSQHSVTVVHSLCAARRALSDGTFDLLLVDYDLDDGKGDELLNELRASGQRIIAIGVSSHDNGNSALLRAGASAVCSKMHFDRIEAVIEAATVGVNEGSVKDRGLLWWLIPGALAGMPMPFVHPERRLNMGGALTAYPDELPVLHAAGIRAVVSLLNIPSDASVYGAAGFNFLCLPVPDGHPPSPEQAVEFVEFVARQLADGRPVAVHCEAGLGRTGTLMAAFLISKGEVRPSRDPSSSCRGERSRGDAAPDSVSGTVRSPAGSATDNFGLTSRRATARATARGCWVERLVRPVFVHEATSNREGRATTGERTPENR